MNIQPVIHMCVDAIDPRELQRRCICLNFAVFLHAFPMDFDVAWDDDAERIYVLDLRHVGQCGYFAWVMQIHSDDISYVFVGPDGRVLRFPVDII